MNNTASSAQPDAAPGTIALQFTFTPDQTTYLTTIATGLGMSFPVFLDAFIRDKLPPQDQHRAMFGEVTSESIAVDVLCAELLNRLERVAAFNEQTVEQWLLSAISNRLEAHERQMIFHPSTGRVIGDARKVFQIVSLDKAKVLPVNPAQKAA